MNSKGFTLIEMLITLFIISSLFILTLTNRKDLDLDYIYMMNDYIKAQVNSICDNQRNDVDGYSISFNENGHVNRANTFNVSNHLVTIHLGNGYLTYE